MGNSCTHNHIYLCTHEHAHREKHIHLHAHVHTLAHASVLYHKKREFTGVIKNFRVLSGTALYFVSRLKASTEVRKRDPGRLDSEKTCDPGQRDVGGADYSHHHLERT